MFDGKCPAPPQNHRKKQFIQSWTNIWRLFHFLAQCFFTTSETDLDYYHQKVSVRVASRVAERLKT